MDIAVRDLIGDSVRIGDIEDILRREVIEAEVTVENLAIVTMIEITTETVTDTTDNEMTRLAVIEVQDIPTEMITVIEITELHHTQVINSFSVEIAT